MTRKSWRLPSLRTVQENVPACCINIVIMCAKGRSRLLPVAGTQLTSDPCWGALQATSVFTFSDIVKTTYTAVKINVAANGSVAVDTADKTFATSTFKSYPTKSYLVALNYGSAAMCSPLVAPGTGARLEPTDA